MIVALLLLTGGDGVPSRCLVIHHVAFLGPDYQGGNDDVECKERTFYQEATILKQPFQGTSNSRREFGVIKKFRRCTLDNWKSFKA